jgi:hypothetical protein
MATSPMNGRSTIWSDARVAHGTTVSREQREIGIHRRESHLRDAVAHVVLRRPPGGPLRALDTR